MQALCETDCGNLGSAEPFGSRRRPMSTLLLWNLSTFELPGGIEDGMSGRGRKSPSCPAGVVAAVGTIRGASELGGWNITKPDYP
jgi:hypothetical protein